MFQLLIIDFEKKNDAHNWTNTHFVKRLSKSKNVLISLNKNLDKSLSSYGKVIKVNNNLPFNNLFIFKYFRILVDIFLIYLSIRKIKFKNNISFDEKKFKEVYDLIYDKPYDLNPIDWIQAEIKLKNRINGENTQSFWCSSLMGFIYNKMGWMDHSEDWSLLSPNDWTYYNRNKIKLINCELSKETKL